VPARALATVVLSSGLVAALLMQGCGGEQIGSRNFQDAAPPAGAAAPAKEAGKEQGANLPARKIIYTADVELVVEDFANTEKSLLRLIETNQGYIAKGSERGAPGQKRYGTWKVRLPVARFGAFLAAVVGLGELVHKEEDAQDVTEEYYDLDARIKNKKVEESRLLKHLEESTGKLEEILAVEREVSRVREEVERLEGRLRLLQNLTALTTVSVTLHEREGYVPPLAPSFGTQAERTLYGSAQLLLDLGKMLALVAIAALPWLPLLIVAIALLWLRHRRSRGRRSQPGA
jgi:hypothetical protein